MADLRDKKLGGFRILAEIKGASGSQGQIFKAVCEQPPFAGIEPGTVVALKAMAVHDEDGQAWAKLEKRTSELVRLSHPNVVKYYGCFSESGTFNDIHAIVQEFLDGETLKQRLLRCPSGLDADEALHVTEAALAGLEYTAANGIVHRDVKPGNIFLCADGGVKLIDFEVAHQEGGTTTSASGNMIGSFDYMSPDFTNSAFRGDERSDVFSMGVVMHEAITGRTPYQRIEGGEGQANFAFLSRWARLHVDGTNPIRISSRANRLLAHSEEVLAKALAPFPQDRYASFSEFHAGLKLIRYRDLRNGGMAYRILQIVGKGGFGEVYKARLKRTNQLVAIKHLLKAAYAERFYREAKIMAQLHDPCFVRFIDFFVVDHAGSREAFLVMGFLPGMPGSSLRDAIKRAGGAALPLRDTLVAFARFAHGLSVLHSRGIFHRDIKPSNLYYPEGCPERAAIMDLGIARNIHGTATTGQVPGTLDYMPSEVVLTDNRGDSGMDIYALGLCLYEALSGKTAYPRLPQGAAALTAFFTRAKIKAMPDLSDPSVVENAPLHELLVQMTNPELSERIVDTQAVERRLVELAEAAGAGVCLPDAPPDGEEGETCPGTVTFTVPSMEETNPDAPEKDEPGTITDATHGTVATGTAGEGGQGALEQEIRRVRHRRNVRNLAIAAACVVAACGAAWMCRKPVVAWLQSRDASVARLEAERVVSAYSDRGLEAGRRAEKDWFAHWTPGQGRWVDLDAEFFAACTNRFRAEEVKLLDKEAEDALADVVAAFDNLAEPMTECVERAEEWRSKWVPCCSPAKLAECENRLNSARNLRVERENRIKFEKFRSAGRQVAMRYKGTEFSLDECDTVADRWRKMRPDGFPEGDFAKLEGAIVKARQDRMRADDRRTAERESEDVVKAYDSGVGAGDKEAEGWRKRWGKRLVPADFKQINAQIVAARSKRVEVEHELFVQRKKKECEDKSRPIIAGYKDDSADTNEVDKAYAKWRAEWMNDRDLQAPWLEQRVDAIEKEKKAREARDEHAQAGEKAEKEAEAARAAAAEEARQKAAQARAQRVLEKTNEVVRVRVVLVNGYADDSTDKGTLDGRFESWLQKWSRDVDIPPDWFAGQRGKVDKAKRERERRDEIKEAQEAARKVCASYSKVGVPQGDGSREMWTSLWKRRLDKDTFDKLWQMMDDARAARIRIDDEKAFAAKTNQVASACADLVKDYWNDGVQMSGIDERYAKCLRDWEADDDLKRVSDWFAGQKTKVEDAKRARERRDLKKESLARIAVKQKQAKDAADDIVRDYKNKDVKRTDTDDRFATWRAKWEADTNLKADWVQERRAEIEKARGERIRRDKAEEDRKAAWDDSQNVTKAYASGVDAGELERRRWDGKWKLVLAEADYRKIVVESIEPARKAAEAKKEQERLRAEAERRKAVVAQLEKDVHALLEVDRDHVDQWRKRLEQAEQKITGGKSGGVLDERKSTELLNEVSQRRNWVVGTVANLTAAAITVGDRRIPVGQSEFFKFESGMPQGGLAVTSAGYKPLLISREALDGAEVRIGEGKWKLEPIPKARVHVPVLESGVTCLVDGEKREGDSDVELVTGEHSYVYKLKNHVDIKGKILVQGGVATDLPQPKGWTLDPSVMDDFSQKLDKAQQCLEVNDGEFCLRIYHEVWKDGYRLTEGDREKIEEAYLICKEDYKKKLRRAIDDPRFDEAEVKRWWAGVLALYYDLTGKR